MHDSAFRIGELVMRTYCDLPNAKILEIGSLNVNGCLRDAAKPTTYYVGVDLEEGPSVDIVIAPGAMLPVEDDSFDLVMASSVFEHDSRFWDTFAEMCRIAKPGGHVYVNAPSNGTVHRYPMDCWRFYPDAGLALADHARAQGMEIDLVESFIGNRHSDVWNDFIAVFRKGPSAEPLNTAFIYDRYPSLNARTWQSRAVYNESDGTEDMALISGLRERCEGQAQELAQLEGLHTELEAVRAERDAFVDECNRMRAHCERLDRVEQEYGQARIEAAEELGHLRAQCERLGEIERRFEQSSAELAEERGRREAIEAERDRVEALEHRTGHGLARLVALDATHASLPEKAAQLLEEWSQQDHPLAGVIELVDTLARSAATSTDQKQALHEKIELLISRLEESEKAARAEKVRADRNAREVDVLRAERDRRDHSLDWVHRFHQAIDAFASPWDVLRSRQARQQRLTNRLRRAGLFDADAYLVRNPDVASAGIDPLRHYLLHGLAEGRSID